MHKIRTILLNKSVYEDNDNAAAALRKRLKEAGVLLVNVMSSPGAGKTTLLVSLINALSARYKIGVLEADIDSDADAVTVAEKTGVRAVQLHTGGMCHLDAGMTKQGLDEIGVEDLDIVFLENVGNLVCPAEYDTGAHLDMTILSVSEGDDKPLKYPLIYEKCELVVISKIDAIKYFTFDVERAKQNVALRNKEATVIPLSAKTGENTERLINYFTNKINYFREIKNA